MVAGNGQVPSLRASGRVTFANTKRARRWDMRRPGGLRGRSGFRENDPEDLTRAGQALQLVDPGVLEHEA